MESQALVSPSAKKQFVALGGHKSQVVDLVATEQRTRGKPCRSGSRPSSGEGAGACSRELLSSGTSSQAEFASTGCGWS